MPSGLDRAARHRRGRLAEDHRRPSVQAEGRTRRQEDCPAGDLRQDQDQIIAKQAKK